MLHHSPDSESKFLHVEMVAAVALREFGSQCASQLLNVLQKALGGLRQGTKGFKVP